MKNSIFLLFCLLCMSSIVIAQTTPNVTVRIAEATGDGCYNQTDCANDVICFDVYAKVDQPNWLFQSYNIWMNYGSDNSVLSFSSEDPCYHSQGGEVDLDTYGKYRFLGAQYGLPMNQNEEVIIQNFCLDIKDFQALDNFTVTAGGNHYNLVSSVNLVDQNNMNNAINPHIPSSSLTLNSTTLSCITPEPNVTVRIAEATGDGCYNQTDCVNDVICFDVYAKVDQPNWLFQSYNIWMDYGSDNSVLSFSSEDPCYHAQGGAVDLDTYGKYRFLAAQYGLPMNQNEEVIVQNFCLDIEDFQALDNFTVTAGGDHYNLVSSVNLVDQNNMNNAVNPHIPSSSLTLNSSTLSCFDPTPFVRIEEATGNGCFNQTDCANDKVCFDVLISLDQPGWSVHPYNIWMDYGSDNSVLSFSSENPCSGSSSGEIDVDSYGKYRFAAAGNTAPLAANQEVVIHNFCMDVIDYVALDGLMVTVGGDHWNLVSSAHLIGPSSNSVNVYIPSYSLTLNSQTLSCLQSTAFESGSTNDQLNHEMALGYVSEDAMTVFPNPGINELIVSFSDGSKIVNLSVYDLLGRTTKVFSNIRSGTRLDITDLAAGVYMIGDNAGIENAVKFIKR